MVLKLNATNRSLLSSLSIINQWPTSFTPPPNPSATSTASFVADLPSHLSPEACAERDHVFVSSGPHFKYWWFLHGSKFVRCWGMFKMDRYYIVCVCAFVCVCQPQQHNIRGSGDREMTLFFPVQMSISRRPRLRVLFKGAGDQLCVMCC